MKVSDAIKYLLVLNKKVVIPEVGILKASYKKALIDKSKDELYPPTLKIEFEQNNKIEDNSLAEFVATQNNISIDRAKLLVNDFVKELLAKLNEVKKYKIEDLGVFVKTLNNEIKFNANTETSLLPQSFGLKAEKLSKAQKVETKKKKKFSIWWVVIPLIIILLGGAGYYFKDDIKNLFKHKEEPVKPVQKPVDTTKTIVKQITDEDKLSQAGIHFAYVYLGEDYQLYYLISGSYENLYNAKMRKKYLKNRGVETQILSVGLHRITLGGFDTVENVIKKYNEFTDKTGEEAWVLINKEK